GLHAERARDLGLALGGADHPGGRGRLRSVGDEQGRGRGGRCTARVASRPAARGGEDEHERQRSDPESTGHHREITEGSGHNLRGMVRADTDWAVPIGSDRVTTGGWIDVRSPYDDHLIGRVPACGEAEVDRAVAIARDVLAAGPLPAW